MKMKKVIITIFSLIFVVGLLDFYLLWDRSRPKTQNQEFIDCSVVKENSYKVLKFDYFKNYLQITLLYPYHCYKYSKEVAIYSITNELVKKFNALRLNDSIMQIDIMIISEVKGDFYKWLYFDGKYYFEESLYKNRLVNIQLVRTSTHMFKVNILEEYSWNYKKVNGEIKFQFGPNPIDTSLRIDNIHKTFHDMACPKPYICADIPIHFSTSSKDSLQSYINNFILAKLQLKYKNINNLK